MTLLNGIDASRVTSYPFPHLVVHDVLDDELCASLIREYPPLEAFTQGRRVASGVKLHCPAVRSLTASWVSHVWKQFVSAHLTPAFFQDMVRVFRPYLLMEYPNFEARFGQFDALRTGLRRRDDPALHDVLMDAQISLHMPVRSRPCADRGPHVKVTNKPLEGFLYLRPDRDQSSGGDHELFSILPGIEPTFGRRQTIGRDCLRLERVVPYRRNTLVMLLNSPRSVQGLSVRSVTPVPIMYFNFLAEMREPLFDLRRTWLGRGELRMRKLFHGLRASFDS